MQNPALGKTLLAGATIYCTIFQLEQSTSTSPVFYATKYFHLKKLARVNAH